MTLCWRFYGQVAAAAVKIDEEESGRITTVFYLWPLVGSQPDADLLSWP